MTTYTIDTHETSNLVSMQTSRYSSAMTTYTIDTHETVRQFVVACISDKQAEVIVAALSHSDTELATRADLKKEVAEVLSL